MTLLPQSDWLQFDFLFCFAFFFNSSFKLLSHIHFSWLKKDELAWILNTWCWACRYSLCFSDLEVWLKSHQSKFKGGTNLQCHDDLKFGNLLQMLILHRALQFVLNCFVRAEQAKSIKKLRYLQAHIMTVASNMYQFMPAFYRHPGHWCL